VAEAQEHFDYDVRNGKRYVKMEEILEVDEESGEQRIIEQPKLLIPDLQFKTMTLQNEETERQFTEALNAAGVPVPYKTRILGTGMDFDEIIEERTTEQVALAVAEQETRKQTYKALRDAGLPIPQDLIDDFRPKAAQAQQPQVAPAGQDGVIPGLGQMPLDLPGLAPTPDDLAQAQNGDDPDAMAPGTQAAPMGQVIMMPPQGQPQRPPESDEQRGNMPKPASLRTGAIRVGIREATAQHYEPPDNSIEDVTHEDGTVETRPQNYRPTGKFGPPRTLGMRRYVVINDADKSQEEIG
jgi:hypothetical protein